MAKFTSENVITACLGIGFLLFAIYYIKIRRLIEVG